MDIDNLLNLILNWFSDHKQAKEDCVDYISRFSSLSKDEIYNLFE